MPLGRASAVLGAALAAAVALAACAGPALPPAAQPSAAQPSAAQPPGTRAPAAPGPAPTGAKVIFDTDFGELNDDSQALFLLQQAGVNVLGVTTVSGNTWSVEGAAYALRQLELQGQPGVPVYQGSADPLFGSRQATLAAEAQRFGADISYAGAWEHPQPADYRQLPRPPYGGYAKAARADGNAVDFIVDQVKRYPHEVTLFALGPATNVALAVKKNPEIVPLVKQVVYMAGAFDVPGNQGPAAEFNVWFDPEAARIAFGTPFPDQLVVPLDVTDTVWYGKPEYDRLVAGENTPIKQEFKDLHGPKFDQDPGRRTHLWDQIAAAVFLRPDLITQSVVRQVQVYTQYGVNYGRTMGFEPGRAPAGAQPARIVQRIDIPRFYDLYAGELGKPPAR
ncbi:nucleoside hydrolase [Pseudonocardia eucalypti]|uniref:Nucleoside hydrolase n=1 Tax=Pseudonocardia eucalypti TaxID=648755 RepID=A0ABP9R8F8_9PSEU|nr:inosine-uridine nucleoside N-ribohydrolase [Pseudonocardia eucalypti]